MKKNIVLILTITLFLGTVWGPVFAGQEQEESIEVHFFYSLTCPHCQQEKDFLNQLQEKYSWLRIKKYEISVSSENREELVSFYEQYQVPREEWGAVPILFTPQKYFLGFSQRMGQEIENCLQDCRGEEQMGALPEINVPFIGKITLSGFSPFTLSVVMGILDGFNACAMTALGFLLALLISTGTRKKVFWIGGTFILVSGLVYFFFIAASLNLFLILEQLHFITLIVGAIIILFAFYLLRDYVHGVVCKLCRTDTEKQGFFVRWEQKMFQKMEKLSQSKKSLPVMLLGVALVSAGVNMVELICSFGFPLAFTKILTSLNLPSASYYFYLLVYVVFYMIDDFIIFVIAVTTLEVSRFSEKYLRVIKLVSALVLLGLGIVMMFKPELLALI